MDAKNVEIGAVYRATITGKPTRVRIEQEHDGGGWSGINLTTNRRVHIKHARKLLPLEEPKANDGDAATPPRQRAKKRAAKRRRAKQATATDSGRTDDNADTDRSRPKRTGCLGAAAQVLEEAGEPMTCTQMMERILQQELWTTKGKTPAATLYAAIAREIQRKGEHARFVLAERGKFTLNH